MNSDSLSCNENMASRDPWNRSWSTRGGRRRDIIE